MGPTERSAKDEWDLEKDSLRQTYSGPFADTFDGETSAGMQVAVIRHEAIV